MDNLDNLINQASKEIETAKDLQQLDHIRVQYLGKKGKLTVVFKKFGKLSVEEKAKTGQALNIVKDKLKQLIQQRVDIIKEEQLNIKLLQESIDITLPGRGQTIGSLHPITMVRERIEKLFISMGFDVVEGPEIEDEFHNFEALNMPAYHPARNATDTFYLQNIPYLLRTHTSPVQIRAMQSTGVPLRAIAPGRVYRRDSDATHSPMFHQVEGLVVDEDISLGNLKAVLNDFFNRFFEKEILLRFRPSYFPFTEPSAEVDLQCLICEGKGCRVCSETGWLEFVGCGMVHPNVFKAVGIDNERYTGFAFGIGIDRLAMFRYGIDDLRMLFENDLRFLEQF